VPALAFIGFGELAAALAAAASAAGVAEMRAWSRPRTDARGAETLRERMEAAGATPAATLEEALVGASLVLACVPGSAASGMAERAAESLASGAVYADLASAPPADKERAAVLVSAAGGRYADAAVLGAVAASGARVPILAAGSGAAPFAELATGMGLEVEVLDAPAGAAARVKLLRSVYLKGRDALVAEMMLGARRHGLEQTVANSIAGPGEEVPFEQLAERVLCSLALHAGRRAEELGDASSLLAGDGVDPLAAAGAAERLRLLAGLGLRESFGDVRPGSAAEVLERIERLGGC